MLHRASEEGQQSRHNSPVLQIHTHGHQHPKYIPANFKTSPPRVSMSVDRGKERKSHVDAFFQKPQRKPPRSEQSTQATVHYPAQLRKAQPSPVSQGLQRWYLHRRHRGIT